MKRSTLAGLIGIAALGIAATVGATEFQTPGALGMGGAGVARNNGALTAYWNPAGGAFNTTPFAMNVGVGIGVRGSDGLTENVDRFKDVNFDSLKNFNNTTATATDVGNMVKTIAIFDDIEKRKGNIALAGQIPVGFSINRVSFGLYGNLEGYVQPKADIVNVLPIDTSAVGATPPTVTDLYNAVKGTTYTSSGYFTSAQVTALQNQINTTLGNPANSLQLVYAIESQLKNSGISADTAFSSLANTALPTLQAGGTNTIDKNTTSVLTKGILFYEVPVSYGHPFDFGNYGQLGLGITGKVISGTVYQNQVLIANRPSGDKLEANDLFKEITKNNKQSVNFGVDLGALYKYDKWLNVGIVAKNLNSPKFDAPDYFEPEYNPTTKQVTMTKRVSGQGVTLKPQLRAGIAVDPFSWLTLASDIDLTQNDTVSPGSLVGSSVKSQNFGGGFEAHPLSWLRLRAGAYKNLASSDVGLVLTGGFTLFLLDVDLAMATDTFKVGSTTMPQEAKVQVGMSFAF